MSRCTQYAFSIITMLALNLSVCICSPAEEPVSLLGQWELNADEEATISFDPANGLDLTQKGSRNALALKVLCPEKVFPTVVIRSGVNRQSSWTRTPSTQDIGRTFIIPLADFVAEAGPGADLEHVRSLSVKVAAEQPQKSGKFNVIMKLAATLYAAKSTTYQDIDFNGEISPGDVLVYTVTISNSGTLDATNVVFSDTPGANSSLVVGSVSASSGTVALGNSAGDNAVQVNIPRVAVPPCGPASVVITFRAAIDNPFTGSPATVCNHGLVTSPDAPTAWTDDPSTGASGDATCNTVNGFPSISLLKTANQTSYTSVGDVLTYKFTVTNSGNVPLTGIVLSDPNATVAGGPLSSLAPGAVNAATFTASHIVTQADVDAGNVTNTATVSGTPPSGPAVFASDTNMVPGPATGPSLALLKNAVQTSYTSVGNTLTYTFKVTNNGTVTLTNVMVTDPGSTVTGGPLASLAPGATNSTTFKASHTVIQADIDAGSFTNTATVSGTPPFGPAVTGTASATVMRSTGEGEGEVSPPANAEEAAQLLTDIFNTADADHSGGISETEATTAVPGLTHELFVALDIDGNGQVTQQELNDTLATNSCLGCNCSKSTFTVDGLRRHWADFLALGLVLVGLIAFRGYKA